MPYVIIAKDKGNALELRTALRGQHLEYLKGFEGRLLAGGALTDDDGSGGYGTVFILDTEDRAEAEAFARNDPFAKGGLFDMVQVTRWRKAIFDRKLLV
jgi:uncharacterized protein YciI